MANPFTVAVPNVYEALLAGERGYKGMRDIMAERDIRAARREAGASLGDSPLARLLGVGDIQGMNALANIQKAQREAQGVYGTPIYGIDPQTGETVLGAIGKSGQFQRIDTRGVIPTPGIRTIDTGTGTAIVNARSGLPVGPAPVGVPGAPVPGQPVGYIPKDVAGEARQKKLGSEEGEKIAGLGQAKAALDSAANNLDRMAYEARRIMNNPAVTRITGLWSKLPSLPGGAAANLEAKLETLRSQVGFGVLQAMRDASKTGGALGQVSNIENQLLQNNLAALSQAQSADEFKRAMQQIIDYAEGAKKRLSDAYQTDYGNLSKSGGQPSQPAQQQFREGMTATNPQTGQKIRYEGGRWVPIQ